MMNHYKIVLQKLLSRIKAVTSGSDHLVSLFGLDAACSCLSITYVEMDIDVFL
jgi:hypothetical protein